MPKAFRQTVDLRNADPVGFGDAASRQRYLEQLQKIRSEMTVPYQVAPRARVKLPDGTYLEPGDEVREDMLAGIETPLGTRLAGWEALRDLVWRAQVIARD